MASYEFTLIFALPDRDAEPSSFAEALYKAGCDDAVLGVGARGLIALDFTREAPSADEGIRSAVSSVQDALSGSRLLEVKPDLVNLSDVAELMDCSRQNVRKYAAGGIKGISRPFPDPAYFGTPSLWHLRDVASWLSTETELQPSDELLETACAAYNINQELHCDQSRIKQTVARADERKAAVVPAPAAIQRVEARTPWKNKAFRTNHVSRQRERLRERQDKFELRP